MVPPIWSHSTKPKVGKRQVEKRGKVNKKEELGTPRNDTTCTQRAVSQVSRFRNHPHEISESGLGGVSPKEILTKA